MTNLRQCQPWIFGSKFLAAPAALALTFACALSIVVPQQALGQTLNVLHSFVDGNDGYSPFAGMTIDQAGSLYGAATDGGPHSAGAIFKLKRQGSGWIFTVLHDFNPTIGDGAWPYSAVTIGPDGAIYGTTFSGGSGGGNCSGPGCGAVFRLTPPATFCRSVSCPWTETVLYRFQGGGTDGGNPYGSIVFDANGNIYGTTTIGGSSQLGTVYMLTRSGNSWTESTLYNFAGGNDGATPESNLTFDSAGNLYGTTYAGGRAGKGTVFELIRAGSGWSENPIYQFQGGDDGYGPYSDVIFDSSGNLYGTTVYGGLSEGGTAFELSPLNGGWVHQVIQNFNGGGAASPYGNLILDGSGNLFGTTVESSAGPGMVFELTPSNGMWTLNPIVNFTGGTGPASPFAGVTFDQAGNLYGATIAGGADNLGTVFQLTP